MKVCVLGASGTVGREVVLDAARRSHEVHGQTRNAERLQSLPCRGVHVFEPDDSSALNAFLEGADLVVFALGIDHRRVTTFFSDTTRKVLDAMVLRGVPKLIAITGVGAGSTRGHGGFLYDRLIYPLFTRNRYLDKERQEQLIADSELDWIVVRPGPFSSRPRSGALQTLLDPEPGVILRHITPAEVARFVVDQFE
ncbi:MAG: NAD(P)H-binding protein, partial [Xanthomonadales bacterium]|nr:NAD(P)H-binding protein [Xanthomonadales bacterium]